MGDILIDGPKTGPCRIKLGVGLVGHSQCIGEREGVGLRARPKPRRWRPRSSTEPISNTWPIPRSPPRLIRWILVKFA